MCRGPSWLKLISIYWKELLPIKYPAKCYGTSISLLKLVFLPRRCGQWTILIFCQAIWGQWTNLLSAFGVDWTCPFLTKDLIQSWMHFSVRKKAKAIWRAASLLLF